MNNPATGGSEQDGARENEGSRDNKGSRANDVNLSIWSSRNLNVNDCPILLRRFSYTILEAPSPEM